MAGEDNDALFRNIGPDQFSDFVKQEILDGLIVDVREPHEWAYYHLDEAVHMPMQSIPGRIDELPADRDIYVICAHGVRSAMVCDFLQRSGFERVINVEGGMAAVSRFRDGFAYD